jgi:hypothetical protein
MLQILPFFVIGSALWAIIEIAQLSFIQRGYRIAVCIAIGYFSVLYFGELFNLPMQIKAYLLRLGLISFFADLSIIARVIRIRRKKAGL